MEPEKEGGLLGSGFEPRQSKVRHLVRRAGCHGVHIDFSFPLDVENIETSAIGVLGVLAISEPLLAHKGSGCETLYVKHLGQAGPPVVEIP